MSGSKSTQFKLGSTPWNKGMKFEDCDSAGDVVEHSYCRFASDVYPAGPLAAADVSDKTGCKMLLRPKGVASSTLKRENVLSSEGSRIRDNEMLQKAITQADTEHRSLSAGCAAPSWKIKDIKKMGLGWKSALHCRSCRFQSHTFDTYKTVPSSKRGPNPVATNVGLAVALQDTPMGNTRLCSFMPHLDVPAPCRSTLQRHSNAVGDAVTKLNKDDMADRVQKLKATNPAGTINIAVDGRYNSTTIASRKKPGQNASQAIGIACETMTEKQSIVAAAVQNKLCWSGAWLRSKGFVVECPGGHPECTANTYRHAPLSEFELGKDIGRQLSAEGARVKYVTTDGDSRSAAGVAEAMHLFDPMLKVERQADPVHLGQAQFRQCLVRACFQPQKQGNSANHK